MTLAAVVMLVGENAFAEPILSDGAATVDTSRPSEQPEAVKRQTARRLFSIGLELVRERRYAAAKALFLEAYAAEPHYVVLYNIAQAELRLGERAAAIQHLRQFLSEGGNAIEPEQQKSVEADIARAETELHVDPDMNGAEFLLSAANEKGWRAQPTGSASSSLAVSTTAAGIQSPRIEPARPLVDSSVGVAPPAWTYGLIVGGFAMIGGAAGLYIWNDNRHQDWHKEDSELDSTKRDLVNRGIVPGDDAVLVARAAENDELLASVQRLDAVPFVVAGAGMAAMGLGLWALVDVRDTGAWSFSLGASQVRASAEF